MNNTISKECGNVTVNIAVSNNGDINLSTCISEDHEDLWTVCRISTDYAKAMYAALGEFLEKKP